MLAWSAIKGPLLKAAPWLGLVAAILIGWHIAAVHYRSQGRAEVQATANAYKQQRDTWVVAFHASDANFRTAMAAIGAMNSDANALAGAYNKSKATDALNVAQSNARWENTQKRMSVLQGVIAKNGGCAVARENIDAMGEL